VFFLGLDVMLAESGLAEALLLLVTFLNSSEDIILVLSCFGKGGSSSEDRIYGRRAGKTLVEELLSVLLVFFGEYYATNKNNKK